MKVKRFIGQNMESTLQRVREEMGRKCRYSEPKKNKTGQWINEAFQKTGI